jgi:tetratricopeptide (TPR) repeat protein
VARVKNRLGTLYVERTQFARAQTFFEEALEARLAAFGPTHSRTAQTYKHLLTVHQLQEHYAKALECAKKALKAIEVNNGVNSSQAAQVWVRIGEIYYLQDGHTSVEGRSALQTAHGKLLALRGKEHREVKELEATMQTLSTPPEARRAARGAGARRQHDADDVDEAPEEVKHNAERKAFLSQIGKVQRVQRQKDDGARQKKQKNLNAKQNWWKQGYNDAVGGDESDSDDDEVDEGRFVVVEESGKVAGASQQAALNQSNASEYDGELARRRQRLRHVQGRLRRRRRAARRLPDDRRPPAPHRRDGRHGPEGLVRRRRGAVEARHSHAQVPDRARRRHELGRHGEDLAPHVLQRAARRARGAPGAASPSRCSTPRRIARR